MPEKQLFAAHKFWSTRAACEWSAALQQSVILNVNKPDRHYRKIREYMDHPRVVDIFALVINQIKDKSADRQPE